MMNIPDKTKIKNVCNCRTSDTEKLEGQGKISSDIRSMWTAPEILREDTFHSVYGEFSQGLTC